MPILQSSDRSAIQDKLKEELESDVKITLFTKNTLGGLYIPGRECQTCETTQTLMEEVTELSPKITLEVIDYYGNQSLAQERGVDKIPAIIFDSEGTDSLKYYGLPGGSEFPVFLDTLVSVSEDKSNLEVESISSLRRLDDSCQDIHIQVFVTPN